MSVYLLKRRIDPHILQKKCERKGNLHLSTKEKEEVTLEFISLSTHI